MNRGSLLRQLRIEREDEVVGEGGLPWRWIIAGAVMLLIAGAGIWFIVARPDLTAVRVADARAAQAGLASSANSLLDASGYVVARRQATVSSKITGRVTEVLIEEGDHVAAGQIIARLDDTNANASLQLAQANVLAARIAMEDARPLFLRSGRLLAQKAISQEAFDMAKARFDSAETSATVAERSLAVARVNEDDTVVRAPFAGVVTVKAAQPGEIVSPISAGGGFTRTGICTIVDMDSLEVDVDVAESFINRVRRSMPATAILNAYPDWQIPADVIAVVPTADRSKATVSVRVRLKAHDARIIPEMGARVEFLSDGPRETAPIAGSRAVLVPPTAVIQKSGTDAIVFVVAAGRAERRAVRLGALTQDGQILAAGVMPGESVAVDGTDRLTDGAGVRIVNDSPQ